MVKNLAKRAMTTDGQKACLVIDHLVEALGNEPSSSLRRAMILCDIDQYPGTSQVGIMERLNLHKSALNREIDWLFNYGCVMMKDSAKDARIKEHYVCGYSKKGLDAALDYFQGQHENMQFFLNKMVKFLRQEKPTLRDARIVSTIYENRGAAKSKILAQVPNDISSTDHRAFKNLVSAGVVSDG